jgi:hypothetical protein
MKGLVIDESRISLIISGEKNLGDALAQHARVRARCADQEGVDNGYRGPHFAQAVAIRA